MSRNKSMEIDNINKKNNSFYIDEKKIISIIDTKKIPKVKKIKFNDLPNNKEENNKINEESNSDIFELKEENNKNEEFNKLELNYKQMYKELEKLKYENNYIKNKLEEISQNQNKKNIYSPYNKYKKNLNIRKLDTGWNNKIPLLTSYLDKTENIKNKSKRIYGLNSLKNLTQQNNIITYKKREKSDKEKLNNEVKNKLILPKNKLFSKSKSYNNFNKSILKTNKKKDKKDLSIELNERNKMIKRLNNNLTEQSKITENRLSLLLKDKKVINERIYMLNKEREEYKIKKEMEIKKYINELNNNQKIIKELNTEKDKLLKSKNDIELLNNKLKNIILEEKNKRQEYERMYKIHNMEIKEKEKNDYGYKNKESIMKLKYDIMLKENKEMKNQLILLKEELAKNKKEKEKESQNDQEKNDINDNNNSKIFFYQDQDIKEDKNNNEEKSDNNNNKIKNEEIKINNEELKIFNNHIDIITENKKNQILIEEMKNDLDIKNNKITELENELNKYIKENENLLKNKEKIDKEKEELNIILLEEKKKNENLEENSKAQKIKYEKYKHKYEEYKIKAKNLKEENEKMRNNFFHYREYGSVINDTKHLIKLRENIFQLKEKLDEEKTKTEALKLIAEDEKEKNDDYKEKYNTAKKLNSNLINKLKERDIAINKNITKENNLLKKKIVDKDKKIEELKTEIKANNTEIEKYKTEIKKFIIKEKDYIKEKSISIEQLNKKDLLIKEYTKKIEGIIKKYEEEKNRNKNLTIELKELNLKHKRILEENSKKELMKTDLSINNKKSENNNSFDINCKNQENNYEKIEPKSSNDLIIIKKYKDNFKDLDNIKEIKKFNPKNDNEDNISISESLEEENENKENNESETISEDNPELYKEVEKIMNINKIQIQNEFDKNNEKTNSSFKDDKSTKIDIDKI